MSPPPGPVQENIPYMPSKVCRRVDCKNCIARIGHGTLKFGHSVFLELRAVELLQFLSIRLKKVPRMHIDIFGCIVKHFFRNSGVFQNFSPLSNADYTSMWSTTIP